MIAAGIYVAYLMTASIKDAEFIKVRGYFVKLALGVFVLGTLIGLTSTSNTPKLATDYNKTQDLRSIEQLDDSAAMQPLVIQDISRQPSTVEDRAASAVDIRERVKVDLD